MKVENSQGVCRGVAYAELDGKAQAQGAEIALVDDGTTHVLRVVLGAKATGQDEQRIETAKETANEGAS